MASTYTTIVLLLLLLPLRLASRPPRRCSCFRHIDREFPVQRSTRRWTDGVSESRQREPLGSDGLVAWARGLPEKGKGIENVATTVARTSQSIWTLSVGFQGKCADSSAAPANRAT